MLFHHVWNRQIFDLTVLITFGDFCFSTTKNSSFSIVSVLTFLKKCPNKVQEYGFVQISYKTGGLSLYNFCFSR